VLLACCSISPRLLLFAFTRVFLAALSCLAVFWGSTPLQITVETSIANASLDGYELYDLVEVCVVLVGVLSRGLLLRTGVLAAWPGQAGASRVTMPRVVPAPASAPVVCAFVRRQLGPDSLGVIVGVGRTEVTVLNRIQQLSTVKPQGLRGKRNTLRCGALRGPCCRSLCLRCGGPPPRPCSYARVWERVRMSVCGTHFSQVRLGMGRSERS
jgi:hypothetical protein